MNFFRRLIGSDRDSDVKEDVADNQSDAASSADLTNKDKSAAQLSNQADDEFVETAETKPVPLEYYGENQTNQVDVNADTTEINPTITDERYDETGPVSYGPVDGATRPLSADHLNIFEPHSGHVVFGQSTDQGMVRTNNQDASIAFFSTSSSVDNRPDFGMFVVADGMGGHHEGEKASAVAIRVVSSQIINEIYIPLLNNENIHDAERMTIGEILDSAVKQANASVMDIVKDGGTTVTAMIIIGDLAHIAHVGDSRAYLISGSDIEQITRDHSVVQRLIELNQLTREEAGEHPQRNVLYRAVGQSSELEVDTLTRRLPAESHILICSDGLWGAVSEDEVMEILRSNPEPQDACEKLIGLANNHGGHDNITVILVKMPGK